MADREEGAFHGARVSSEQLEMGEPSEMNSSRKDADQKGRQEAGRGSRVLDSWVLRSELFGTGEDSLEEAPVIVVIWA